MAPSSRTFQARWTGLCWAHSDPGDAIEVRFVGPGPGASRAEVLSRVAERDGLRVAWARQVHSARVLAARPGECGRGDALWTAECGLALCVATADCVPVLIGGGRAVAAVHAGWRGIAAGIVGATVSALPESPERLTAWIGPAIGPCCYEVGEEVAQEVAAASSPEVVRPGPRGRPHLDLPAAVAAQLAAAGIGGVSRLAACTRCEAERLWSFRRDGPGTGRNLAFIWRP